MRGRERYDGQASTVSAACFGGPVFASDVSRVARSNAAGATPLFPSYRSGKPIEILERKLLIAPGDISASGEDFEVIGTFNPGVAKTSEGVVLLVRVVERPRYQRPGFTGLPYWLGQGICVEWFANADLEFIDPRVVRIKSSGLTRLTFTSYLQVIRCPEGESSVRLQGATFSPELPWEAFGVEDPRITPLADRYFFTYVAVSPQGVATALAVTDDFRTFNRLGVIFGPENKDVVLFPEKIGGDYVALHRPSGSAGFARPGMWLARSPDLIHWGRHQHFLRPGTGWDSGRIGGGAPPLWTNEGWLVIYHGNQRPQRPGDVGVYAAGALLLAHDDPGRILRASTTPLFGPVTDFECDGFVPNVVFPTGIISDGDSLLIYYGAGDTVSAVIRMSLDQVLSSMSPWPGNRC